MRFLEVLFLYLFAHEISRETLGGKNSNAPLLWDASVVSILNEAEKGHLVWSSINVWAIHELRQHFFILFFFWEGGHILKQS